MEPEFTLGEPALVCRWRLAGRHVPLLNRHMRALSQRRVGGEPLTTNMLGWVKQHIEWSLADDTTVAADGVLMLVVDVDGQAAMSSGAYKPLPDASASALAARARTARDEAAETGVAPEALCALRDGVLSIGVPADAHQCGALTFIRQLAETRGCSVDFTSDIDALAAGGAGAPFLVSDEHGVVAAAGNPPQGRDLGNPHDREGALSVPFLSEAFETLRDKVR